MPSCDLLDVRDDGRVAERELVPERVLDVELRVVDDRDERVLGLFWVLVLFCVL